VPTNVVPHFFNLQKELELNFSESNSIETEEISKLNESNNIDPRLQEKDSNKE
jgi:hypothetical protein